MGFLFLAENALFFGKGVGDFGTVAEIASLQRVVAAFLLFPKSVREEALSESLLGKDCRTNSAAS